MKAFLSVLTAFILFTSAGCVTQRKCLKRYPVAADTLIKEIIKDSIIVRDTTVTIFLKGERVIDSVSVEIEKSVKVEKVRAETSLAYAEAWLEIPFIKLELVQKDTTIEQRLKDALIEKWHYQSLYERLNFKPESIKYVPKFYKFTAYVFFALVSVIIFWIVRKFT